MINLKDFKYVKLRIITHVYKTIVVKIINNI